MTAPPGLERDFPLKRLTTVRTGGAADYFARPETQEALLGLLVWAVEEDLSVGVVGSGSNLLIADSGFRGLALKLAGALAGVQRDGERLVCGGGARLPSIAAKAAEWGLGGLEFAVNIPGTVGGAVRMNANAYGGELTRTFESLTICTATGAQLRSPDSLGLRYRDSDLASGEVVSSASFRLLPGDSTEIKDTLSRLRAMRHEAQPSGIKTFGSTFTNPDDERAGNRTAGQLLAAAGCGGLRIGDARLSDKHANFIENLGSATTVEIVALMTEARRRVLQRFGVALVAEVQVLGEVVWPEAWTTRATNAQLKP